MFRVLFLLAALVLFVFAVGFLGAAVSRESFGSLMNMPLKYAVGEVAELVSATIACAVLAAAIVANAGKDVGSMSEKFLAALSVFSFLACIVYTAALLIYRNTVMAGYYWACMYSCAGCPTWDPYWKSAKTVETILTLAAVVFFLLTPLYPIVHIVKEKGERCG